MAKPTNPRDAKVPVSLSQGKMMLSAVKLNSVTVSLILVIVAGTFLISSDVQAFLNQRRQIAEMEMSIQQAERDVEDMQAERDRWQDPVYIRSQARDRLYYVLPGEVSYLVMDTDGLDLTDTSGTVGAHLAAKRNADEISLEVAAANENWVDALIVSGLQAALGKPEDK